MNNILFIGYSASHPSDFVYKYPERNDFYLLLLITSPAELMLEGKWQPVSSGTAILYSPGQEIHYRASGEAYTNDWIRFRSDEAFVTGFPAHNTPFTVTDPEYCHNLIKLLTWESSFHGKGNELILSDLLHALFLKLKEDSAFPLQSPHTSSILKLRKQIYNQPQRDWTLPVMARDLHISPGYLQALYKSNFGISCMEDVIHGRLRLAKDQLLYTDKTTAQIAEFCGYRNVEHFCRQFKKNIGYTPSQYRHLHTGQRSALVVHANVSGNIFPHG